MNPIFISLLLLQAIPEVEGESTELSEQIEIIEEKPDPVTGEFAVDPYPQTNENAGAKPFGGANMSIQFGGKDGIRKITDRLVDLSIDDPRISEIFKGQDMVRLRRTLFEQFCYILAAGCDYSGRDMRSAHADMGLERKDLNALVEHLQRAMEEQDIAFSTQNKFLAKLAPMDADVLQK